MWVKTAATTTLVNIELTKLSKKYKKRIQEIMQRQSFLILFAVFATALAQYPDSRQQYGPAPVNSYSAPQPPPQENEVNDTPTTDLKVFRHVFVHSVPNDGPQESKIRHIRGPGGDEQHVSIIFVKAPAPATPDQQVVNLSNDGGRKTLIYVLLKKAEDQPEIAFSSAHPTKPSKPQVYFIRYKKDPTPPTTTPTPATYGDPTEYLNSGYSVPSQDGYQK